MSNLSEAQKEILTIEYFYPETSTTTVGVYMNAGKRDPNDVRDVVQRFMNLHESFRMKLRRKGEEVERYYVNESAPVVMTFADEAAIKKELEDKSGQNMFKWDDYLYEMSVHVATNGDVYTAFFGHHLIVDGIGMYIYIKGIHDLLKTGECEQPLLTLDECVEEEAVYDESKRSEKSRRFWEEKIKDYDGTAFGDERQIDATNLVTTKYATTFDPSFIQALEVYCETNHVSLTQLISGAVLLCKSKITNNASAAINTTLHGRSNRRKRGVLSTFARMLPLIMRIDDESSVLDYLETIKTESAQLMRHYKVSHYDLIALTKDVSGLDDISISVQISGEVEQYYPTLIEGGWLMPKESMRPLTIHIREEKFAYQKGDELAAGFELSYEFLPTVFDKQTIVNMHEKLVYLLTQMIASQATLLKDITLLTQQESDFLMDAYHQDAVPYANNKTIVDVFEEQVIKNPEKVALIYNDVTFTYETLNAKANQLAHYLIETYDIEPEDKVG
ncbi:MAG: condensation domain-containing protein, partial [Defluviitaleaceae bacterium]|nr:condensation domain-containing protein [Defluviitaleaceae bacterium]